MRCTIGIAVIFLMITIVAQPVAGGPAAYGLCQAACAAGVMTCYGAAGFVFGTVTAGINDILFQN